THEKLGRFSNFSGQSRYFVLRSNTRKCKFSGYEMGTDVKIYKIFEKLSLNY
ncbi:hypothetical protein SAMN02745179_01038, partial [Mycoplasmopsis agassizii]